MIMDDLSTIRGKKDVPSDLVEDPLSKIRYSNFENIFRSYGVGDSNS